MEHTNINGLSERIHNFQNAFSIVNALQIVGFIWLPEARVKNESIYDYIVVGAGTAGSVVARRLAEDKTLKILLIEAGGNPPLESVYGRLRWLLINSKYVYNFTTENDGFTEQCHWNNNYVMQTGKMLGSSSSVHEAGFERGTFEDYEQWAQAANTSDWNLESLIKYFKKSESVHDEAIRKSKYKEIHGFSGPIIVTRDTRPQTEGYLEALRQMGKNIVLDLNGNTTVGYTQPLMSVSKFGRYSSARGYLSSSVDNLDILKHTEVQQIFFDGYKNAIGLTAVKNNRILYFKTKREIILTAGTFNTPKLLMVSGIGPRKHLESKNITVISNLPVGENYQDTAAVLLIHKLRKTCKPPQPIDVYQFQYPYLLGYVSLNNSRTYADYVTVGYLYSSYKDVNRACILRTYDKNICDNILKDTKGGNYDILLTYLWKAHPKSRGKIVLRSSNPTDTPIIKTGIFSDKSDLDDYIKYIKDYIKIENTPYFKEQDGAFIDPLTCRCQKHEYRSNDYWRCYTLCMMVPFGHCVGTAALGTVVDARLKVRGVRGLRVADASVIPTITTGGTMSSTIMLGEKAAQIIKDDMN